MATQSETRAKFIKANPGVKRAGKTGYWYKCAHCGKWCGRPGYGNSSDSIPADQKMEVDHIVPWSKGGSDELYNLQPLCRPCNRSKSNNANMKDGMSIRSDLTLFRTTTGTIPVAPICFNVSFINASYCFM